MRRSLKTLAKAAMYLLLFCTLLVGGAAAVLFKYQGRLIYFPTAVQHRTPADVGLDYEALRLPVGHGNEIDSWLITHNTPLIYILFFHGNAGNIADRMETLQALHNLGAATLIIDYQGFGKSSGKPSEQATYQDALAAWTYLTETRGIAPQQIALYGRSLGGGVASYLATRTQPAGLVIESSFSSLEALAAEVYPWLPTRWFLRHRYPTTHHLAQLQCPVLIAHSPQDGMIDITHAQTLLNHAQEPKFFYQLSGTHNNAFATSGADYLNALRRFLVATQQDHSANSIEAEASTDRD